MPPVSPVSRPHARPSYRDNAIGEVSRLEMPGLGVSKLWITLPLPIGFAIMFAVAAMRLFRQFPTWLASWLLIVALALAWCAACRSVAGTVGQPEPAAVLRGNGRCLRPRRCADRDRFRRRHLRLHGAETEPIVIKTRLDGTVSVWAPVADNSPTRSPGPEPLSIISGNAAGATAAMSAALEPEVPDTLPSRRSPQRG